MTMLRAGVGVATVGVGKNLPPRVGAPAWNVCLSGQLYQRGLNDDCSLYGKQKGKSTNGPGQLSNEPHSTFLKQSEEQQESKPRRMAQEV